MNLRIPALLLISVLLLLASAPARASQQPPSCGCAPTAELTKLRDRIAAAPDLVAAQEMAVAPVEQVRTVVAKLAWASSSMRGVEKRIAEYESNVRTAKAPAEVADQFGSLVRLASSGSSFSDAGVSAGRCHYSTVEIIAIVIGFILAIIPGIILMILMC